MKKLLTLVLAAAILSPVAVLAKKNDEGLAPQYQLEGAGVTSQNAQQVLVTIVTKKKDKVKAVSYTHLDVYKRQVLTCLA